MVPGIAINPGTSVETVMEMLRIVKKVLVMSVNPGNAGQMYLPYVGKKITKLLSIKEDMDFEIYWDGACSADKILEYAPYSRISSKPCRIESCRFPPGLEKSWQEWIL